MTDKEVMQQALDALENHAGNCKFTNSEYVVRLAAITALKNAITQPAQPKKEKNSEISGLIKQVRAYKTLTQSLEYRIATSHANQGKWQEALTTLASERKANAILTGEIDALRAAIAQPVQPVQPRDVDWQPVSKLIEANDQAKSLGFMPGTSNWGAMLWKAIAQPVQPTEPIGCVGKDGCTILYFTSELLPFETDLYIHPPA